MRVDLVVHGASQVVTCAAPEGVKRGAALGDVGIVPGGALAVSDGRIVAVGPTAEVRAAYSGRDEIDVAGKVICPGFVDAHTHLVFAGQRIDEFERKLAGASYMEILQAGGGILSTMRATQAASRGQLAALTHDRLCELAQLGTTTVEIKTGYGLDTASELKLLDAIADAATTAPCAVVPTFLGAHAVPPPYAEQGQSGREAYVDLVVEEMLPAVAAWRAGSAWAAGPFFCDVFCEPGAFDYAQTSRILETAKEHGLALKLHADQFVSLGGVRLAVELGATSVDHLEATPPADCALLGQAATVTPTVAVVLPAVNFHLGSTHFADARGLIAAGAALALATDANPGSAPCLSLPFVMGLACRYQKLTPAEALNAATINAAYALGLADRVGSIEVGKQADLAIVDGEDYRGLMYWMGRNLIVGVIRQGRVIAA